MTRGENEYRTRKPCPQPFPNGDCVLPRYVYSEIETLIYAMMWIAKML